MNIKREFLVFCLKHKKRLPLFFIFMSLFFASFTSVFVINNYSNAGSSTKLAALISNNSMYNSTTLTTNVLLERNKEGHMSDMVRTINRVQDYYTRYSTSSIYYEGRVGFNFDGGTKVFTVQNENYVFGEKDSDFSLQPPILISSANSMTINDEGVAIHDFFKLAMMFDYSTNPKYTTNFVDYDNFCFITKERADYILKENSTKYSNYGDLIGETLFLTNEMKSTNLRWRIANIFIPYDGTDYDFYQNTYGDFICAYAATYYYDHYSISFDFGNSDNDNLRNLQIIFNFADYNFDCKLNEYNIINKTKFSEIPNMIMEYKENLGNPGMFILYSSMLLLIPMIILLICSVYYRLYDMLIVSSFFGFALSYAVFWIIANANVYYASFFSNFALMMNIGLFIVYLVLVMLIKYLMLNYVFKNKRKGKEVVIKDEINF